ncbi:MAG TPA: hypothetical protein PLN69_07830 [bacterium]|nr:hypothetical protein [bacterium]
MKCRKCGINEAAFFISWGDALGRKIGFCDSCAEEVGIFSALRRVESLLHGFGASIEGDIQMDSLPVPVEFAEACHSCGTELVEFERKFMFGCEECSKVFGSLVANYMTILGGNPNGGVGFYRGDPPNSYSEKTKISDLRKSIDEKIRSEEYDKAAKQRDRLNALEEELNARRKLQIAEISKKQPVIEQCAGKDLRERLNNIDDIPTAGDNWLWSQIEIRRNFSGLKFPSRANASQREYAKKYVTSLIPPKWLAGVKQVQLSRLAQITCRAIGERLLHSRIQPDATVLFSDDMTRFAFINGMDHVMFGTRTRERDAAGALSRAMSPVKKIEREAEVAFNPRFGFITTQPKHLGTGLSVSVILHLPYCFFRGKTFFWPDKAENASVRLDSLCGKNLEHHGFYRVSSTVGFGRPAEEIVAEVYSFAERMVAEELDIKNSFKLSEINRIKNLIPRVMNNSTRSYRLSYQDVLRFASFMTIGVSSEALDLPAFNINDVIPRMSSIYVMYNDRKAYSINQCEKRRADLFADIVDYWQTPELIRKKP